MGYPAENEITSGVRVKSTENNKKISIFPPFPVWLSNNFIVMVGLRCCFEFIDKRKRKTIKRHFELVVTLDAEVNLYQ